MSPREIHEFDQASRELADKIPGVVRAMFEGYVRSGFNEFQALSLAVSFQSTLLKIQMGGSSES